MNTDIIPILDHGYIQFVDSWGSDESIIEAARMSTGKGFLGWGPRFECTVCGALWKKHSDSEWSHIDGSKPPQECCNNRDFKEVSGDEGLLKYLWEHKHATPFEMAGMVIEVQAPIFVFREWHRHRTQSYNEMSARYTPLPDLNYIPTVERLMIHSRTNKQAGKLKEAKELTEQGALEFRLKLQQHYESGQTLYEGALEAGISKELARIPIPVGRYSRMRASANLRNWLAFLTLRMEHTAQWEIQQYATALGSLIQQRYPRTWERFLTSHKY